MTRDTWSFTWVRDLSVGYDLKEQNSKGPHVGLNGEGAVVDGLWSRPLDGKFGSCEKTRPQLHTRALCHR